jgi:hypothetical protein
LEDGARAVAFARQGAALGIGHGQARTLGYEAERPAVLPDRPQLVTVGRVDDRPVDVPSDV